MRGPPTRCRARRRAGWLRDQWPCAASGPAVIAAQPARPAVVAEPPPVAPHAPAALQAALRAALRAERQPAPDGSLRAAFAPEARRVAASPPGWAGVWLVPEDCHRPCHLSPQMIAASKPCGRMSGQAHQSVLLCASTCRAVSGVSTSDRDSRIGSSVRHTTSERTAVRIVSVVISGEAGGAVRQLHNIGRASAHTLSFRNAIIRVCINFLR